MIYQQTSLVVNTNIENVWSTLKKAVTSTDFPNIFDDCVSIEKLLENDGKITRTVKYTDRIEKETITINFSNYRISVVITNNQNYFGEITYSLIKPSEEFLSEKHTSLIIISAWRMHPGVFAAPGMDRQKFIDNTANNIKLESEKQISFF